MEGAGWRSVGNPLSLNHLESLVPPAERSARSFFPGELLPFDERLGRWVADGRVCRLSHLPAGLAPDLLAFRNFADHFCLLLGGHFHRRRVQQPHGQAVAGVFHRSPDGFFGRPTDCA